MEWISTKDRLPNEKEQDENWKFLVGNERDNWTDSAYYNPNDENEMWDNGECYVIPTHWMPLPNPPKQ